MKVLVFDRLEGPSADSLDHHKDQLVLDSTDHRGYLQNSSCNECSIQMPNSNSKGKRHIDFMQDSRRILGCGKCS